jgi:hypothetical protein
MAFEQECVYPGFLKPSSAATDKGDTGSVESLFEKGSRASGRNQI